MSKLLRFASSQENIDRLAIRLALVVGVFGVAVAIVTIAMVVE